MLYCKPLLSNPWWLLKENLIYVTPHEKIAKRRKSEVKSKTEFSKWVGYEPVGLSVIKFAESLHCQSPKVYKNLSRFQYSMISTFYHWVQIWQIQDLLLPKQRLKLLLEEIQLIHLVGAKLLCILSICWFKDLDSVLHLGYDDLYLLDRRGHTGLRSFPVTTGLLVVAFRNLDPSSIVRCSILYIVL